MQIVSRVISLSTQGNETGNQGVKQLLLLHVVLWRTRIKNVELRGGETVTQPEGSGNSD